MRGRESSVIARYVIPLLSAIALGGVGYYMVIDELPSATYHPETSQLLGLGLVLGVILAGMVGWLVIEVRYYRARQHDANRVMRSRSRRW
jgi:hypothetical protein